VGGTRDTPIDVRIVAATNRDLPALVADKAFRQDLYFRLAAAVVNVPPLRERSGDLPILVPRLLAALGHDDSRISESAFRLLGVHAWPGNVRELKNALACAMTLVDAGVLEAHHLQIASHTSDPGTGYRLPPGGQTLASVEEAAIRQTLVVTHGNKAQAARLLGIASSTLYEKLRKYEI
jgi:transcriptional regulator with PAS, ATPase and Fis domain